jgi:AraC family transcriptional regulator
VTLAFKAGLPGEIYQTLTTPEEKLLDDHSNPQPVQFFEKTYPLDAFLHSKVLEFIEPASTPHDGEYLNEQMESILTHILIAQKDIYRDVMAIKKVKTATRIEIYRRLQWAMEYIHNHYDETISIDVLASQACLSVFHFKRLFREVFHEAPYQYIRKLRLQKASELLLKDWPVGDVCKAVGWEDTSSFIRLFKQMMNTTPNRFRKLLPQRRGDAEEMHSL